MTHIDTITLLIERHTDADGLTETGIEGVKLFRAVDSVPCQPVVYEPCLIALASGAKEVALDGTRHVYSSKQYLCCPLSMPIQAGTSTASAENPLYGVYISLNPRKMTELAVEIENHGSALRKSDEGSNSLAIRLADWDDPFAEALLRLLQLVDAPVDKSVLADARLRELYYTILRGEIGAFARNAFGVGNAISRAIAYVSENLGEPLAIDDLAERAGMSRAVFHRKFKSATAMSPIQFVKTMRLNTAAMKISEGATISQAAMDVGYLSPSQFSREFKRLYGQTPRQWSEALTTLPS
ncbi:AraC family transcriptional regulator [Algirhabdus cladophorae]|uniref:AraC family transcriptional regulator n=1 Tax=Algirhabdus cladophorae TaxID=3377108 RepID=UPI003B845D0C